MPSKLLTALTGKAIAGVALGTLVGSAVTRDAGRVTRTLFTS